MMRKLCVSSKCSKTCTTIPSKHMTSPSTNHEQVFHTSVCSWQHQLRRGQHHPLFTHSPQELPERPLPQLGARLLRGTRHVHRRHDLPKQVQVDRGAQSASVTSARTVTGVCCRCWACSCRACVTIWTTEARRTRSW